ncbi:hypothetical protein QJQ45_018193 [Haematococcus lacustris]|nr:hypothetical protein QJQ45_018193 [Haematococcus lacustris]
MFKQGMEHRVTQRLEQLGQQVGAAAISILQAMSKADMVALLARHNVHVEHASPPMLLQRIAQKLSMPVRYVSIHGQLEVSIYMLHLAYSKQRHESTLHYMQRFFVQLVALVPWDLLVALQPHCSYLAPGGITCNSYLPHWCFKPHSDALGTHAGPAHEARATRTDPDATAVAASVPANESETLAPSHTTLPNASALAPQASPPLPPPVLLRLPYASPAVESLVTSFIISGSLTDLPSLLNAIEHLEHSPSDSAATIAAALAAIDTGSAALGQQGRLAAAKLLAAAHLQLADQGKVPAASTPPAPAKPAKQWQRIRLGLGLPATPPGPAVAAVSRMAGSQQTWEAAEAGNNAARAMAPMVQSLPCGDEPYEALSTCQAFGPGLLTLRGEYAKYFQKCLQAPAQNLVACNITLARFSALTPSIAWPQGGSTRVFNPQLGALPPLPFRPPPPDPDACCPSSRQRYHSPDGKLSNIEQAYLQATGALTAPATPAPPPPPTAPSQPAAAPGSPLAYLSAALPVSTLAGPPPPLPPAPSALPLRPTLTPPGAHDPQDLRRTRDRQLQEQLNRSPSQASHADEPVLLLTLSGVTLALVLTLGRGKQRRRISRYVSERLFMLVGLTPTGLAISLVADRPVQRLPGRGVEAHKEAKEGKGGEGQVSQAPPAPASGPASTPAAPGTKASPPQPSRNHSYAGAPAADLSCQQTSCSPAASCTSPSSSPPAAPATQGTKRLPSPTLVVGVPSSPPLSIFAATRESLAPAANAVAAACAASTRPNQAAQGLWKHWFLQLWPARGVTPGSTGSNPLSSSSKPCHPNTAPATPASLPPAVAAKHAYSTVLDDSQNISDQQGGGEGASAPASPAAAACPLSPLPMPQPGDPGCSADVQEHGHDSGSASLAATLDLTAGVPVDQASPAESPHKAQPVSPQQGSAVQSSDTQGRKEHEQVAVAAGWQQQVGKARRRCIGSKPQPQVQPTPQHPVQLLSLLLFSAPSQHPTPSPPQQQPCSELATEAAEGVGVPVAASKLPGPPTCPMAATHSQGAALSSSKTKLSLEMRVNRPGHVPSTFLGSGSPASTQPGRRLTITTTTTTTTTVVTSTTSLALPSDLSILSLCSKEAEDSLSSHTKAGSPLALSSPSFTSQQSPALSKAPQQLSLDMDSSPANPSPLQQPPGMPAAHPPPFSSSMPKSSPSPSSSPSLSTQALLPSAQPTQLSPPTPTVLPTPAEGAQDSCAAQASARVEVRGGVQTTAMPAGGSAVAKLASGLPGNRENVWRVPMLRLAATTAHKDCGGTRSGSVGGSSWGGSSRSGGGACASHTQAVTRMGSGRSDGVSSVSDVGQVEDSHTIGEGCPPPPPPPPPPMRNSSSSFGGCSTSSSISTTGVHIQPGLLVSKGLNPAAPAFTCTATTSSATASAASQAVLVATTHVTSSLPASLDLKGCSLGQSSAPRLARLSPAAPAPSPAPPPPPARVSASDMPANLDVVMSGSPGPRTARGDKQPSACHNQSKSQGQSQGASGIPEKRRPLQPAASHWSPTMIPTPIGPASLTAPSSSSTPTPIPTTPASAKSGSLAASPFRPSTASPSQYAHTGIPVKGVVPAEEGASSGTWPGSACHSPAPSAAAAVPIPALTLPLTSSWASGLSNASTSSLTAGPLAASLLAASPRPSRSLSSRLAHRSPSGLLLLSGTHTDPGTATDSYAAAPAPSPRSLGLTPSHAATSASADRSSLPALLRHYGDHHADGVPPLTHLPDMAAAGQGEAAQLRLPASLLSPGGSPVAALPWPDGVAEGEGGPSVAAALTCPQLDGGFVPLMPRSQQQGRALPSPCPQPNQLLVAPNQCSLLDRLLQASSPSPPTQLPEYAPSLLAPPGQEGLGMAWVADLLAPTYRSGSAGGGGEGGGGGGGFLRPSLGLWSGGSSLWAAGPAVQSGDWNAVSPSAARAGAVAGGAEAMPELCRAGGALALPSPRIKQSSSMGGGVWGSSLGLGLGLGLGQLPFTSLPSPLSSLPALHPWADAAPAAVSGGNGGGEGSSLGPPGIPLYPSHPAARALGSLSTHATGQTTSLTSSAVVDATSGPPGPHNLTATSLLPLSSMAGAIMAPASTATVTSRPPSSLGSCIQSSIDHALPRSAAGSQHIEGVQSMTPSSRTDRASRSAGGARPPGPSPPSHIASSPLPRLGAGQAAPPTSSLPRAPLTLLPLNRAAPTPSPGPTKPMAHTTGSGAQAGQRPGAQQAGGKAEEPGAQPHLSPSSSSGELHDCVLQWATQLLTSSTEV